jgi:hypothetical protein
MTPIVSRLGIGRFQGRYGRCRDTEFAGARNAVKSEIAAHGQNLLF